MAFLGILKIVEIFLSPGGQSKKNFDRGLGYVYPSGKDDDDKLNLNINLASQGITVQACLNKNE